MRAVVRSAFVALMVAVGSGVASAATPPTWHETVLHVRGGGELEAIACVRATTCMAVGSYEGAGARSHALVESLASGRWRAALLAQPAGTVAAQLSGVSCEGTTCVAVGDVVLSNGTDRPSIWVAAGASWRRVRLAYPSGFATGSLEAVSCARATSCVAVGSWQARGATSGRELVESLSGGRWAPASPAAPSGTTGWAVGDVACAAPTACVAVGTAQVGGTADVVRDRLAGGAWHAMRLPTPGVEVDPQLLGVSCAGAWCLAVGGIQQPNGSDQFPLTESGSAAWSASTPHAPGSHWEALAAVACTARATCAAVGPGAAGQHGAPALVATVHDGRWSLRTLATPPGTTAGTLSAISCSAEATCVAVGSVAVAGLHEPLVARYG